MTDDKRADEIERLAMLSEAAGPDAYAKFHTALEIWFRANLAVLRRQPPEALKAAYFEGYEDALKDRQLSSDQVLAEMILKCRDALIQADYIEAWHWLYQLQEKVGTGYDPYKPWEHLERLLSAAEAEGRGT